MLGPNVIIGLCILGAVFVCVAIAAMAKICLSRRYNPDENLEDLFRPHTKSQIDRLREVKWINLMYIWEAGRMAKYEMGERVDPRPRKRGMLLGGGLDQYSGHYGNVSWEEGVDDWDSEETSGGGQSAAIHQDYSSNAYHNSIGDGTANPSIGCPQPPIHSQPKSKHSREAYNTLEKSDDDEGDDITPFPILHGLPEHARVQLKLPREQEFAREIDARTQQQTKKLQPDVRPVSDMSLYHEQAEAAEYAAAAQKRRVEAGQQAKKGQDNIESTGETIELSEIPRIVLNDLVEVELRQHIGRAC